VYRFQRVLSVLAGELRVASNFCGQRAILSVT